MSWLRPLSCHVCGPCFAVVCNFLVVVLAAATLTPHDRCGPGFSNFRTLLLLLDVTSQFPELLDFGPESPVVFCNCTSANHIGVVEFSVLLAACNSRGGGCDDVDECCCVAHSFSRLFRLSSGNSHGGGCVNQCCSAWEPCI